MRGGGQGDRLHPWGWRHAPVSMLVVIDILWGILCISGGSVLGCVVLRMVGFIAVAGVDWGGGGC